MLNKILYCILPSLFSLLLSLVQPVTLLAAPPAAPHLCDGESWVVAKPAKQVKVGGSAVVGEEEDVGGWTVHRPLLLLPPPLLLPTPLHLATLAAMLRYRARA